MVLTYMFALMGIQSAPAFSMWSFGNQSPKPFAPQQVWASSFCIGLILFFFTAFQGMGAHLLGANQAVTDAGLALNTLIPDLSDNKQAGLVPHYFNLIADAAPWLVGLLAVCALAAMQSTGAAYMSTAGAMLTRDLYKRYLNPTASHTTQKLFGRMGVGVIVLAALVVASTSADALVLLGGLAVAFGFQMWPSLASICWFPWITRQGATLGLAAGLLGVIFTETFGATIAGWFGIDLPWGRWPWTIHSAGWGMILNLAAEGACGFAGEQARPDPGRLDHHPGLVVLRNRSGRGVWQLHLRCPGCRRRRLDLRDPVDLGLADPVLAPRGRDDVDAGLQDGDVHRAGTRSRGAGGRHRRRGSGEATRLTRCVKSTRPGGGSKPPPFSLAVGYHDTGALAQAGA
jgi:hypothetical protein